MNTPNKLTVLRILLIPFFVAFLLIEQIPLHYLWALLIFVIASITDLLDGKLARKNDLVTTFGKFLDPLADKLLVVSALICFIELKLAPSVVVLIIIAREFLVTGVRLLAAGNGKVIAAGFSGKVKTVSQMVAVIVIMFMQFLVSVNWLPQVFPTALVGDTLLWISAACTVYSGAQYVYGNREYILHSK